MQRSHSQPDPSFPGPEELLERQRWLRGLAQALVGRGPEAEDLVQDTWLAAQQSGGAAAVPRAWLARVLKNRAASGWRSRQRRLAREEAVAAEEALPSAAELAARADVGRRLTELVLELPPDPQRILLLRFDEGLSCAEIARRLGRPEATVRSQLARALGRLRERLQVEDREREADWLQALAPLLVAPRATAAKAGLGAGLVLGSAWLGQAVAATALVALAVWLVAGRGAGPAGGGPDATDALPPVATPDKRADGTATTNTTDSATQAETAPRRAHATAPGASTSAPLRGVVRDPRDGSTVPWYALLIGDEGRTRVRTDGDGRFETPAALPAGEVVVLPLEDYDRVDAVPRGYLPPAVHDLLRLNHTPSPATEHALEFAVGPGFLLDVDRPELLAEQPFHAHVSDSVRRPSSEFHAAHVQRDPRPFVRFAPLASTAQRRSVATLQLASDDGLWMGRAAVELGDSNALRPLAIALVPAATLTLAFDVDVEPHPGAVEVELWEGHVPADELELHEPVHHSSRTTLSTDGIATRELAYLPAGPSTLRVRGLDFAAVVLQHELEQGPQRLAVPLERTRFGSGVIEGTVTCRGAEAPQPSADVLVHTSGGVARRVQARTLAFEPDPRTGVATAAFRFEALPDEEFRVYVQRSLGELEEATWRVTPRDARVRPDGPPLAFELDVRPAVRTLAVQAHDAATGEPLAAFRASASPADGSGEPETADAVDGVATLAVEDTHAGGRLWVRAPGYGGRVTALPATLPAADAPPLEVALERGWGAPIQALDAETLEPVPGVDVLADGRFLGRTDALGLYVPALSRRPERLELRHDGRAAEPSGPIDPDGTLHPEPDRPLDEVYLFRMRRE